MRTTLDVAAGSNGGAMKLLDDPKRARNIQITVINPTNTPHAAFFANQRRELDNPGAAGHIPGIAVVNPGNTVASITIATIAYFTTVLQGWTGELWAAADASNVTVEYQEGAGPEK
jgi:hypothetical protein